MQLVAATAADCALLRAVDCRNSDRGNGDPAAALAGRQRDERLHRGADLIALLLLSPIVFVS